MKGAAMAQNDDERFMRVALDEARKAFNEKEIPVGAVVVCNNTVIARAHNLTETLNDPTAHAEMQAITSAAGWLGGKYLKECTMYVTLEPCSMCAAALGWAQITRLVYGAGDRQRGYTIYAPDVLHPKTIVNGGLLADDCEKLITDFFKMKR